MTATIFVQIAAYRDPDLPATLHNLIERAAQPERLQFGICLQLGDNDPNHWGTNAFPDHPQISVCSFRDADSLGACWAGRQAQSFYGGEDFLLQIDSHMRAVERWDELLLKTWAECSDPGAVLSVYPNGFQQPCFLQTSTLPVMGADGFDENGILRFQASVVSDCQNNSLSVQYPGPLSPEDSFSGLGRSPAECPTTQGSISMGRKWPCRHGCGPQA